jgi:hypothetical protein
MMTQELERFHAGVQDAIHPTKITLVSRVKAPEGSKACPSPKPDAPRGTWFRCDLEPHTNYLETP